jgi:ankyrin repeat protein
MISVSASTQLLEREFYGLVRWKGTSDAAEGEVAEVLQQIQHCIDLGVQCETVGGKLAIPTLHVVRDPRIMEWLITRYLLDCFALDKQNCDSLLHAIIRWQPDEADQRTLSGATSPDFSNATLDTDASELLSLVVRHMKASSRESLLTESPSDSIGNETKATTLRTLRDVLNYRNMSDRTPAQLAVKLGRFRSLDVLVAAGSGVPSTALGVAAAEGHVETVRYLLVTLNGRDNMRFEASTPIPEDTAGRTAVHLAAAKHNIHLLELFESLSSVEEMKALLEQKDRLGRNALHHAAMERDSEVETLQWILRRHPQLLFAVDNAGSTAAQHALKLGHRAMSTYLIAQMKNETEFLETIQRERSYGDQNQSNDGSFSRLTTTTTTHHQTTLQVGQALAAASPMASSKTPNLSSVETGPLSRMSAAEEIAEVRARVRESLQLNPNGPLSRSLLTSSSNAGTTTGFGTERVLSSYQQRSLELSKSMKYNSAEFTKVGVRERNDTLDATGLKQEPSTATTPSTSTSTSATSSRLQHAPSLSSLSACPIQIAMDPSIDAQRVKVKEEIARYSAATGAAFQEQAATPSAGSAAALWRAQRHLVVKPPTSM